MSSMEFYTTHLIDGTVNRKKGQFHINSRHYFIGIEWSTQMKLREWNWNRRETKFETEKLLNETVSTIEVQKEKEKFWSASHQ